MKIIVIIDNLIKSLRHTDDNPAAFYGVGVTLNIWHDVVLLTDRQTVLTAERKTKAQRRQTFAGWEYWHRGPQAEWHTHTHIHPQTPTHTSTHTKAPTQTHTHTKAPTQTHTHTKTWTQTPQTHPHTHTLWKVNGHLRSDCHYGAEIASQTTTTTTQQQPLITQNSLGFSFVVIQTQRHTHKQTHTHESLTPKPL